jgi:hypothetical protein
MGGANRATTLVLRRTVFVYKLESRSYIARTGDGCIPSRLVTEIELLRHIYLYGAGNRPMTLKAEVFRLTGKKGGIE